MFIKKLALKDIRSHADTELELSPLTVFKGPNGSGKTSIAYAIKLALTGKAEPLTDAKGAGAEALIRSGSKSLQIGVEYVQNGALGMIRYERNAHGSSWFVGSASGKNAAATIEKNIAPVGVISAVLEASRFLEMSANEQRDLLAKALASDPVELVQHELLKGMPQTVSNAADVESLYKHFYERRTEVNREIKALGDSTGVMVAPAGMPTIEEAEKQIAVVQKDRDSKLREKSKLESSYTADRDAFEAAKAQMKLLDADVLSGEAVAALKPIAENSVAFEKLSKEINAAGISVQLIQQQIESGKKRLDAQADKCQACGQHIANAAETRNGIRAEISEREDALEKANKYVAELKEKRTALGDPAAALAKIERHRQSVAAWTKADVIVKKGAPAEKPDTSAIEKEIEALDARLAKGNDIRKRIVEFEAQARIHAQKVEKREKLERQVASIEQMVEYFGPTSKLRDQLVGDKLEPFVARINAVLNRFGFDCELSLNPYSLRIQMNGEGLTLDVAQLSESEQYRFSVAFNVALAEATGVGFVLLDRADVLLDEPRKLLSGALLTEINEGRLAQAIVLSSANPSALGAPSHVPAGVCFYHLENSNDATEIAGRWDCERAGAYAGQ